MENKKNEKKQYDAETKKLLKAMGINPEDEEEMFWLGGGTPMYGSAGMPMGMPMLAPGGSYRPGGLEKSMAAMPPYSMPSSMMGAQGYNPFVRTGARRGVPGDGKTSAININYTASDGTMYQMSVVTPEQNKGAALYNTLCGLYGVMMAEGQTGQNKGDGKGYGKGFGKPGSYGGGKGGK